MKYKERWQFFLVWFALGVVPLFLRPLWQPDEGRYAEIPREMLETGNWLTPHLNYVLYFEKPPFQYWLSAISMQLFGQSAFAARLPLALAAFLTMYAAFRLARRLGSDRPVWASYVAISCLLLYACGQILTLDALFSSLCVFSLAAIVEAVCLRYSENDSNSGETLSKPSKTIINKSVVGWTLAGYVSAACAVLTKGPVVLVIVGGALVFSLYFVWRDAKLRNAVLATIFSPYGWLVFLVIAVPWFVMVNKANPGHAQFFFFTEHIERFTTQKHSRHGSSNSILDKLYFVPVILVGVVPWLTACFAGIKTALGSIGKHKSSAPDAMLNRWIIGLLLIAFAWPLLFFSLSGSKLIPYVMPCIVPLIAVAVGFETESDGLRLLMRAGREILVMGAIFTVVALLLLLSPAMIENIKWMANLQGLGSSMWILFLGLAFVLLGFWGTRGVGLSVLKWAIWHGALLVTLTIASQQVSGRYDTIDDLIEKVPHKQYGKIQWISHGNYFQALPFLVKERVTLVGSIGELRYGKENLTPAEQSRWFIEDPSALTETAWRLHTENPHRPVWALVNTRYWKALPEESKAAWEVIDGSIRAVLLRYVGCPRLRQNKVVRNEQAHCEAGGRNEIGVLLHLT